MRVYGAWDYAVTSAGGDYTVHMVMAGVDLRTVVQILGHRTLQMTMSYAHLAPGHLQDAAQRLGNHIDGHFMDTGGRTKKSPKKGGSLTG